MEQHEANASLIAAAPDLLESCKALLTYTRLEGLDFSAHFLPLSIAADAAIAKAEGGGE
jgi:hypothetical protein